MAPLPWAEVNTAETATVANLLSLKRAREQRKYNCPVHGGSDSLHAYPGAGGGFYCWGACQRKYSNVDLAAEVWGLAPVDACKRLATLLGIPLPDETPFRGRRRDAGGTTRRPTTPTPRTTTNGAHRPTAAARRAPEPSQGSQKTPNRPAAPSEARLAQPSAGEEEAQNRRAEVYGAVLEVLTLTERGGAYLDGRKLSAEQASGYGFRSVDGLEDWRALWRRLRERFPKAQLEEAGLDRPPWGGKAPALLIPYHDHGRVVALRFRNLAPDAPHSARYRDLAGHRPAVPFNAAVLAALELRESDRELHVVEGELNAYTLHTYGLLAVGLPGAATPWRAEWTPRIKQATRLVAWYDHDEAAEKGTSKLAAALQTALGSAWLEERGRLVKPPRDINDLHREGRLRERIERAAWRD